MFTFDQPFPELHRNNTYRNESSIGAVVEDCEMLGLKNTTISNGEDDV